MAMSKQLVLAEDKQSALDLIKCGICEAPFENPKALPCLHTFCLGCIEEWAKGKTEQVKCPLCKEDFPLPPEGVTGLRSKYYVTRLKKKEALKKDLTKSKLICTSQYDESENVPEIPRQTCTFGYNVVDVRGEWEMERQFDEEANLQNTFAIAEYPTGDVAVSNISSGQVKVFNRDGQFKHNIDVKTDARVSHPKGVAISFDGTTYVADWSSRGYVKVFDTNAKLINKFQTNPPPTCTTRNTALSGMAIDGSSNRLVVGERCNKYVSIHTLSGSHINSFNVTIIPYSIAAAPQCIILLCGWPDYCAQILNYTGQILYNLNSSPIPGMSWDPSGAHFLSDSEFLLASRHSYACKDKAAEPGGIYHYSTKGEFLGQIVMEVNQPQDVIITEGGKLLVLEAKCVRMLKKK